MIRFLFAPLLAGAALSADMLAVVEKVAGQVGFYTVAGQRIGGVKVGTYPHEIVRSPDGKYLYVSNNGILWMQYAGEGGNTISVIDVVARRSAGEISLGKYRRPHGMDVDPKTGRIVVTIENPDGLLLVDPIQRKVLRYYDVKGEDPHMVLLGPGAEYAYVSNTATNTIAAVHLASANVKLIPVDAGPQGGTLLSPDGRMMYVTCAKEPSIAIVDLTKQERVGRIATGKGVARVALTPDGKTLVYNLGEGGDGVAFADIASRKEVTAFGIGGRPLSLTLSKDGRWAYLGVQDQDRIVVVDVVSRKIARQIKTPKGAGPDPVLPLVP